MDYLQMYTDTLSSPWITAGLDVQYKVVEGVLSFQCTRSNADWIHNFYAWKHVYSASVIPFAAHAGFTDMWLSVQKEIELLDFHTITGYSQGAALAGFAHENFFHRKGYEPETIVFGCPRFLHKPNSHLLARFTRFTRVKNRFDIVTFAPPFGYKHSGKEIILGSVKRPDGMPLLQWLTGHTPSQYRIALGAI